ncbi:MAG: hypothetical protein JJ899_06875, partial [Alphaproteobacteria bacterium]|nr:hypothetical protein [Alphaproteobacteria bacterium]
MTAAGQAHELDRRFDVSGLAPADILDMRIETSEDERAAIAARLGILSVDALEADLHAVRETSGDIAVYGSLSARVNQACVVSLEPVSETVEAKISQRFSARFADEEEGEDEDPL